MIGLVIEYFFSHYLVRPSIAWSVSPSHLSILHFLQYRISYNSWMGYFITAPNSRTRLRWLCISAVFYINFWDVFLDSLSSFSSLSSSSSSSSSSPFIFTFSSFPHVSPFLVLLSRNMKWFVKIVLKNQTYLQRQKSTLKSSKYNNGKLKLSNNKAIVESSEIKKNGDKTGFSPDGCHDRRQICTF